MAPSYQVDDANVAWRVAGEEAVVLHAATSAYFGLNPAGTLLWAQLARTPLTLDQLASWARRTFPDFPADGARDVAAFVDQLLTDQLILRSDTAGSDPATGPVDAQPIPAWEAPAAERFGELEKLILSGE